MERKKEKAVELRKKGFTYRDIAEQLDVRVATVYMFSRHVEVQQVAELLTNKNRCVRK